MKKFGPQDESYVVLYDASDSNYIHTLTKKSPDYFHSKLEEKYNDHPSLPEFIGIAKAEDVVTFPGLSWCMQLILGTQTTRFNFMCVGSSSNSADPFKQILGAEATSRINMTTAGTIVRISESMQFLANFPASFQTITVRESGVNTASVPNTGILLNRNVFASNPITHVSGDTAFTMDTRITFSGVTTYG